MRLSIKRHVPIVSLVLVFLCTISAGGETDIPRVYPNLGTVGTEFTVSGWGFGEKKPMVFVGKSKSKVIAWSDSSIRCLLTRPMPPGDYDVTVRPASARLPATTFTNAFTVMPPQITFDENQEPVLVSSGDPVTIEGSFFGNKRGKVTLKGRQDQKVACRLLEWNMDSITFVIPSGLSGLWDLVVSNGVGSTFAYDCFLIGLLPTGPDELDIIVDYTMSPENTCTGIYYNNQFWVFYPAHPSLYQSRLWPSGIWYRRGGDWTHQHPPDQERTVNPGGHEQETDNAVSPVIFDDHLFVFWVGRDKDQTINYAIYQGADLKGRDRWDGPHTIQGASSWGEVSPVYNPQLNRLELYYMNNNQIRWVFSNDGLKWSEIDTITSISSPSPPGATATQSGGNKFQTALAYRSTDGDKITLAFLDNGVVTQSIWVEMPGPNAYVDITEERPFVTNLGNGYLALLWKGKDEHVNVIYYNEKNGTWGNKESWSDKTHWFPTGAVNYQPSGTNLQGTFYIFWSEAHHAPILVVKNVMVKPEKYLGIWKLVNTEDKDWANIEGWWDLCPVVGVVDGPPPFVKNGEPLENNLNQQTSIEFDWDQSHTTGTEWALKAGVYIETGPKNALHLEVQAGLTEAKSTEQKYWTNLGYSLEAMDPIRVMVLYLVPAFQIYTYQWYDENGQPTENKFYVQTLTHVNLLTRLYDPATDPDFKGLLTQHIAGNLSTYNHGPDSPLLDPILPSISATWYPGQPAKIDVGKEEKTLSSTGTYVKFKIGGEIARQVGLGVEGEFEMKITSTTTITESMRAVIHNPYPKGSGDIKGYTATMYWTKPNANGYWVPLHRRGMGDEPWFITYTVSNVEKVP